ncbi:E3 ubiquitin-protein ligase HERC2-like [Sorghum bicolor]|uniref:RCC1-like domain-containing protein n=1 Tax=Sorghum bicolor TaxID=4558 RepID=A0A1B6PLN9_SORBI|nr:E3 ubiquitin-protein ligase HERC2-like [Sorghum bicolor]KXG26580.1 hypothetical protein SORBI_3006G124500 [Sorghum bicolor]OQU81815.1 hypothetical protein SORBI_3006G124500 [Sorghum bicolor]OQU81816.1 hypothetical protein SORBI_3006G124500 [Sorghum bicolor]OQU81817.1 hypothetical protein SORBI_3006G124500 [Sorghum bicolor]|eukprot:XP_021319287.1 E3 ubiquitin-protein ligase HERC2-like [Sorghum bicolor]
MDATESKASVVIKFHNIVNETTSHFCPSLQQIPLTANPSILLHVLSSYGLEPKDLAALEATCKFFRSPANFEPDGTLSLPDIAAYDTCCQKDILKSMKNEEKERLKQRCGGSWKLVLMYLLIGEKNYHRGKSQVVAGPEHSIVVTAKGDVYSFGANSSGQLGLGNTEGQCKPCLIRSLQGIRITQAAVGSRRTMLVSDTGSVYVFGQDSFAGLESAGSYTSSPKVVESLKGIFVVQASVGGYFSAVLSREGQVYTFCWGRDARLGHRSNPTDLEPRLLSGPLEHALVVQIAAGNCYLLMLAYQPTGMSVYSIGCGEGGKLGHGCEEKLRIPRMIKHFQTLKAKPVSVSAGAFHCAVLASDGRVFTWGRNPNGCLGHDDRQHYTIFPTAVASLARVKARYVSAGFRSTFVVSDNGHVYSFGCDHSDNLGVEDDRIPNLVRLFQEDEDGVEVEDDADDGIPNLATRIVAVDGKVVQISATNTWDWVDNYKNKDGSHTLVLTESGRVYSLGVGSKGQLGMKLAEGQKTRPAPRCVDIDLA